MKRLFFLVLFLALAGQAWGATVYVRNNDGTVEYNTTSCTHTGEWTTPSDLQDAVTAAGVSGVIDGCSGSYTGAEIDADGICDTTAASQTFQNMSLDGDAAAQAIRVLHAGAAFSNVTFDSGTAQCVLATSNARDITGPTFTGCSFTGQEGIEYRGDNNAASGLAVTGCTFTSITENGIDVVPQDGTASGVTVTGNTFTTVARALRVFGTEANVDADGTAWSGDENAVTNVDFDGNTVRGAVNTCIFLSCVTGTSYVRNNKLYDTGSAVQANVNAVSIQYCDGVIVENNVIAKDTADHAVDTSACDGHGIIIDRAYSADKYYSKNCIVRGNLIKDIDSDACSVAAGIIIYQGKSTSIYNNIVSDSLVGLKIANPESTGNVFYNNTVYNCTRGASLEDADNDGAPASTWANNIFDTCAVGMKVMNSSVDPTISYNCWYGNTDDIEDEGSADGADLVIGTGAITSDPLFVNPGGAIPNNYKLRHTSPCIDAGTPIAGITTDHFGRTRIVGAAPDIGAIESRYHRRRWRWR